MRIMTSDLFWHIIIANSMLSWNSGSRQILILSVSEIISNHSSIPNNSIWWFSFNAICKTVWVRSIYIFMCWRLLLSLFAIYIWWIFLDRWWNYLNIWWNYLNIWWNYLNIWWNVLYIWWIFLDRWWNYLNIW